MTERDGPALHGWLVIDKPVGISSTDVVSRIKRALRAGGYAKVKVGHGGTLDPLASGVLPVALGEATKLCGRALDSDKAYEFTIAFGAETDTLDGEGGIVGTSAVRPTIAEVEAVLPRFTGAIEQIPPAYSALKVDGRRAYDRARAGETVTLATRSVTVRELHTSPARGGGPLAQRVVEGAGGTRDVSGAAAPLHHASHGPPPRSGEELENITLHAVVSKGTYIRSLARDIARACGTVGHVAVLRRIRAGPFGLEAAITLDFLAEIAMARRLEDILLPLRAGLDDIPAFSLTPDQAGALRQGRVLTGIAADDGQALAMLGDEPVAMVEIMDREVRVVRGFNP